MEKLIVSLKTDILSYKDFVGQILKLAKRKTSSYVCVANVHMCIEAYDDPTFATMVNNADLVTPDGMPLCWALKYLYGVNQERVAGMDLLPDLLKESQKTGLKVFFYGGSDDMQARTKAYVKNHFRELDAVGFYSPPFRALSGEEERDIIDRINESGTQLLFVALGCPKQEKWMASMKGRINCCMVGIGGALPVLIGDQTRAPQWMQRLALEWFYRFCQEPKRLFKRYAYTNSKFLYLLFKQKRSSNLLMETDNEAQE